MERDAICAHGLAKFLKEKFFDNSDPYTTYVCDICGMFAQRGKRRENKSYPTKSDVHYCAHCNNYNKISKIAIPYAFKLMLQELTAMCIAPRIRTRRDDVTKMLEHTTEKMENDKKDKEDKKLKEK